MRLPPDVEADHERLAAERMSGKLILHYNCGQIVGVEEQRSRKRKPASENADRTVAEFSRSPLPRRA